MNKTAERIPTLTKICFLFILCFLLSCIRLCAEPVSAEQAQKLRDDFILEAKKHVGAPYALGAVGPDSFDCSGLIYYCAREATKTQLPRTAKAIYSFTTRIPDKELAPGDLLFFKTTESGAVSHVGIYIGNSQFISAISDGANTGVIVSSLKQDYWKPRYVGAGKFLPFGTKSEEVTETETASSAKTAGEGGLAQNLLFDAALYADWSLFSPGKFAFTFRGIDLWTNARYAKWPLEPGLALALRYNHGLGLFQIPIALTATLNDFVRVYAGLVFSMGDSRLEGSDAEISPSVFPGIIGLSFSTGAIPVAKAGLQFVQDISYTVYNRSDGAALSFVDSVSAGLVFYTGVRVTLPLSAFSGN